MRHGFGYVDRRRRKAGDRRRRPTARGRHLREMLDELGPTFVKFGQLLSTRPDIVPPDIIAELRGLQDDVRPFPFADVERVDPRGARPADRAALPRVRRAAARRRVDRPGAPRDAAERPPRRRQGAAAERAAADRGRPPAARTRRRGSRRSASARSTSSTRARSSTSSRARSGRSSTTGSRRATPTAFHTNFAGHPHVAVPRVYWSYTRARVLTLEYLEGVQLADLELDAVDARPAPPARVPVAEAWMTMIFRHGFFHGDPHPANILVLSPERIGLVDFGLTGKLTDDDMSKLTRLFIDAATENIEALPKRLADLGVRYPKEREEQFVAELRELYYRYYGASLQEIDPIQVIREAFALIYSMNLRLPTRFVMLDKAIATLGVGRRRALPGLQRVRGREAVRARPDGRALHAAARRRRARGARAGSSRRWRPSCRTRCTTRSSRCATARSRSASSTRASTSSWRKLDVALQPARDRARRHRRPDRLEPDRDLREERAARPRRARRSRCSASCSRRVLGVWLLWGVDPLRPPLSTRSVRPDRLGRLRIVRHRFAAKDILAARGDRATVGGMSTDRCSSPTPSPRRGASSSGTCRATASSSSRDGARRAPDLVLAGDDAERRALVRRGAGDRARPRRGRPRRPRARVPARLRRLRRRGRSTTTSSSSGSAPCCARAPAPPRRVVEAARCAIDTRTRVVARRGRAARARAEGVRAAARARARARAACSRRRSCCATSGTTGRARTRTLDSHASRLRRKLRDARRRRRRSSRTSGASATGCVGLSAGADVVV